MKEEILINVTPREVRAAVLDDGVLQELLVERVSNSGLLGNIYKGRVARVLPGMQAAFINVGLQRTAFLHASDIRSSNGNDDSEGDGINGQPRQADIRKLLGDGDELLVQVVKEPLGNKGARLSTAITIPSRYLVMTPQRPGIGVSSRIEDETERERLRSAVDAALSVATHGFIVRTAAEGMAVDVLQADMEFLVKLWSMIQKSGQKAGGGELVHADLPLAVRVIRDLTKRQIERVRVDSRECLDNLQDFARDFMPDFAPVIELYEGRRPIFDLYAIDDEIDRALGRKVDLKSGGHLIIEQTEAMTTIDVNTGGYVGRSNLEDTIFRTNLEAAGAIARQLRLRNLGGIIILDFIDMQTDTHRRQVMEALKSALATDSARNQISPVSSLGLIEMTRKRTRESLEHILCKPCTGCNGRGHVKTPETVCYEIFREILRQHRQFPFGELVVLAHDDVVEMLLDEESGALAELEELTGRPIRLQAQTLSLQDAFDVVPM
ncbi:MAG: ribonuclease G [Gammaproteobacteria bacterium]|nr:MAG: ribonuclease G [Gammaproteobacteria bacterium]